MMLMQNHMASGNWTGEIYGLSLPTITISGDNLLSCKHLEKAKRLIYRYICDPCNPGTNDTAFKDQNVNMDAASRMMNNKRTTGRSVGNGRPFTPAQQTLVLFRFSTFYTGITL